MLWLLLATLTAALNSLSATASKHAAGSVEPIEVAACSSFVVCLVCVFSWAIVDGSIFFNSEFLLFTCVSVGINFLASQIYYHGLKRTDLSLAMPILCLTPLWMLLTEPLLSDVQFSASAIIGIMLTIIGTYTLQFSQRSRGILQPFLSLWSDKGSRLLLVVSFLWSITSVLDRRAVLVSSPLWYSCVLSVSLTLLFNLWLLLKLRRIPRMQPTASLAGMLGGISAILQMFAISLAPAAYVVSVKRLSALFSIFWGRIIFNEHHLQERFIGALLAVLGVALIALGS